MASRTLQSGESLSLRTGSAIILVDDDVCPHLSVSGQLVTREDKTRRFECEPCGVVLTYTTGPVGTGNWPDE